MKNKFNNDSIVSQPVQSLNISNKELEELRKTFNIHPFQTAIPKGYYSAKQLRDIFNLKEGAINQRLNILKKQNKIEIIKCRIIKNNGVSDIIPFYKIKTN